MQLNPLKVLNMMLGVEISGSEVNILWLFKPADDLCSKRDISFVLQQECMTHYLPIVPALDTFFFFAAGGWY